MPALSAADWINIAIATAAFVSAGVAAATTLATFRILRANQAVVDQMRAEAIARERPYIQVTTHLRVGTQLIYLRITNAGQTPAANLRLTLDRPFKAHGMRLEKLAAFSEAIDCFPPKTELRFLLGSGPDLFNGRKTNPEAAPLQFSVDAAYSFGALTVNERTTVDLRPYAYAAGEHDPVAEELERLRKLLEGQGKSLLAAITESAHR